jgi:transcriptional regulator GlxA family with amidase domain
MSTQRVGILVFDDVEVLDFAGPFEVFSVSTEPAHEFGDKAYSVCLISENGQAISCRGGMSVNADYSLTDCPPLDILVIPGGWGTRQQANNTTLIKWIMARARDAAIVASVCTGAFLLAEAGLLQGKRATTHWQSLQRLRDNYPDIEVDFESHVVRDGNIFSSAGIAAGIDMALQVIAAQQGEAVARQTARHMEYPYPENNQRRIEIADNLVS